MTIGDEMLYHKKVSDNDVHRVVDFFEENDYDYYLEKKDILGAKPITNNISKSSSSAISKLNWQEEKVKQAQQKKIKNEIKRTEERMALIEAEIEELDNMYADPAISSDTAKLMEIHTRKEALSKELDELYDKWGELTL